MKDIKTFILESEANKIKTDLSNFDLTKIPEDSGIEIDELKGYDGPNYKRYEYFGDCINTVEKDKMWDATQMSGQIRKSRLVDINNVLDKLYPGDRRIPVKLTKTIEQLKRNNKIDDLGEICCGMDNYQRIMFIYLSKTDTHYFFDCKL